MLHVSLVLVCLESVSLDTSVAPVEYNSLIDGLAAHGVLHASHYFELVLIYLSGLRDSRIAETVLEVVLEQESIGDLLESEGVLVMQVQLHC